MTEYIIKEQYEHNCFSYYYESKHIGLKMTSINLSDNDLSEYISDGLTHEHIHKILDELFNHTVSKLFDGIEHHFRNHTLHEKEIANRNQTNEHINPHESYHTFIERRGFNNFLRYYGVTQEDVSHANKICNNRLYKIDLNQTENITWKKLKD